MHPINAKLDLTRYRDETRYQIMLKPEKGILPRTRDTNVHKKALATTAYAEQRAVDISLKSKQGTVHVPP